MDGVVRAETVWVMRAIREMYPDAGAGTLVDPYAAAREAELNPDGPGYETGVRELLETQALMRSPEWDDPTSTPSEVNPRYEVTPQGALMIAGA